MEDYQGASPECIYGRITQAKDGKLVWDFNTTCIDTGHLIFRGGRFYAWWDDTVPPGTWSLSQERFRAYLDRKMKEYANDTGFFPGLMSSSLSGQFAALNRWLDEFRKAGYSSDIQFDQTVKFASDHITKNDYSLHQLSYDLSNAEPVNWNALTTKLMNADGVHKLNWCIGAVFCGATRQQLQKALLIQGSPSTGKSTILNIVRKLFEGYVADGFKLKTLVSGSTFAASRVNPESLVYIDEDAEFSTIKDATTFNTFVAHEPMQVEQKFQNPIVVTPHGMLFVATNYLLGVQDSMSGIPRRIIDIRMPKNRRLPFDEWSRLTKACEFELGAIARQCIETYRANPTEFVDYVASSQMTRSSDVVMFFSELCLEPELYKRLSDKSNTFQLKELWDRYKVFRDANGIRSKRNRGEFGYELEDWFEKWDTKSYLGFRMDKLLQMIQDSDNFKQDVMDAAEVADTPIENWLRFDSTTDILDKLLADCPAQLSTCDIPSVPWDRCVTKLSDIPTSAEHWVIGLPAKMVTIDLDLKDNDGNKSLLKNLEAARQFPPTYAELSKSGQGIHLHYFYDGDSGKLARIMNVDVEIKVYRGKAALRRKHLYDNGLPVATISSGLPTKEVRNMALSKTVTSEGHLKALIRNCLAKKYGSTVCCVQFIRRLVEQALDSRISFDIRDMWPEIHSFAESSTNSKTRAMGYLAHMKLCSPDRENPTPSEENVEALKSGKPRAVFDIEVKPNCFLLSWKPIGTGYDDVTTPHDIYGTSEKAQKLVRELAENYDLIGFYNLDYDNIVCYAMAYWGYDETQLYVLSQTLVNGGSVTIPPQCRSYALSDIYDYASKKQSLKKWEVEMAQVNKDRTLIHKEFGDPWDKPITPESFKALIEYCHYDIEATRKLWWHTQPDWLAREMLCRITGLPAYTRTNALSAQLIFGDDKHPQRLFNYVKLGGDLDHQDEWERISEVVDDTGKVWPIDPMYNVIDHSQVGGQLIFPGYEWFEEKIGKTVVKERITSTYRGETVGEGGYVIADPGFYSSVECDDVSSMHPHSAYAMKVFGEYTDIFYDLVLLRLAIKHEEYEKLETLFNGRLSEFVTDAKHMETLAYALKIVINAIYGMTAAHFENRFRDPRNIDNIVAKRGALFMINLVNEVREKGYHVVHVKTDSIKIENMTDDIRNFVRAYGRLYGYTFEVEHCYDRLCLVNKAVYIGRYSVDEPKKALIGQWSATGAQFAEPYVFKTLFSHEPIEVEDLCVTKEVSRGAAICLDFEHAEDPETAENMTFIGRVGRFVPVKTYGGAMYRVIDGVVKGAVVGTKGYDWVEVDPGNLDTSNVNYGYWDRKTDEAIEAIEEFVPIDILTAA